MAWFEQGAKPLGATAEEAPTAQGGITSAEVEKWERERNQALQEADQALSTGNATMGTLADQQETLDRAELIAESNELPPPRAPAIGCAVELTKVRLPSASKRSE